MIKTKDKKISSKVVIATCTSYNLDSKSDSCRANLAKKTIKKAVDFGYDVVVVDDGSSKKLLEEFKKYGAFVSPQKLSGFGNSRRQTIKEAYERNKDVVVWMEAEKTSLITQIPKIVKPILNGKADLVVPKRKSLKSYPIAQQHAEPFGNIFWKELTKKDLDVWFGPRASRRDLSSYFLNYNGKYGDKWDSTFIPVMNAIHDGKRVVSVDVDYTHPKEQKNVEEHDLNFYNKRIEQLVNLMFALKTHWKKLHKF